MSNSTTPDFFDTDGRPGPAETAERKLRIWAVLSAVKQGLVAADEACTAYGISPVEFEAHRAGWREFEAGLR